MELVCKPQELIPPPVLTLVRCYRRVVCPVLGTASHFKEDMEKLEESRGGQHK